MFKVKVNVQFIRPFVKDQTLARCIVTLVFKNKKLELKEYPKIFSQICESDQAMALATLDVPSKNNLHVVLFFNPSYKTKFDAETQESYVSKNLTFKIRKHSIVFAALENVHTYRDVDKVSDDVLSLVCYGTFAHHAEDITL